MRLIDADRLTRPEMIRMCYHLPNGDTAMPIGDIEHAPTVDAVPLEPLAEWIVDNLDPRCTCEMCKSDPETAYRDCVNDDCPHMTEQQVKELLVKWMEEQNAPD